MKALQEVASIYKELGYAGTLTPTKYGISFINIYLDSEDLKWLKQMELAQNEIMDFLMLSVEYGYQLKISQAREHEFVSVSLTGKQKWCENVNLCITAESGDPLKGLKCLMYKLAKVGGFDKWRTTEGRQVPHGDYR